jgi:acyl-coenzyme A synthetase/AMP-(fatty) acid ligase
MKLIAAAGRSTVLESKTGALSGAEFVRQVASLAGFLGRAGLSPGDRVILSGPRCAESMVALYACWHGGFVAAPVEAGLPPSRLRPIFEECSPSAVVAIGRRASILLRGAGSVDCFVSTLPESGEHLLGDALAGEGVAPVQLPGDAIGSLHFTSGSTGGAKGVPYTREGIDVFAAFWVDTFELSSADRVAWAFPMAYAPSLIPLGSTVLSGARVVPLAAASASVGDRAVEALGGVSVVLGVPSLIDALLRLGALPVMGLRAVVLAGEPVAASLVLRLREGRPDLRIINLYGTTECNAISMHEVGGGVDQAQLPSGRPLPFMSVQIVDSDGVPCEDGEVVVAGPTVMTGYWGGVHRARWVELDGVPHYRTGDRGRWRADGELQLSGRADRQVKVGGHRVELGPVEAAIVGCVGVQSAAVVASGEAEHRSLVAFLVGTADVDSVRQELSRSLPLYAQPARWIGLEALPRGPRGKVDYAALSGLAAGPL